MQKVSLVNIKKIAGKTLQYLSILGGLLFFYVLCLILSSSIPLESVKNNLEDSYYILEDEGLYKAQFGNGVALWDNWTDAIILNIVANQTKENIFKSAIANNKSVNSADESVIYDLGLALGIENNSTKAIEDYSRYWVGILMPIKFLLMRFNIHQIRYFIFLAFSCLQCLLFIIIYKKLNMQYAIAYMFSTSIICSSYNVCCLAFSTDLLIMQLFSLYILRSFDLEFWKKNRCIHYFIIGSFTFFINFLSAPLLTLGIPVVLEMLLCDEKERKFWNMVKAVSMWFGGYTITVLAKQVFAKLVLGEQSGLWQILHWSGMEMAEGESSVSIIGRILGGSSGLTNQMLFTDRLDKVRVRFLDVMNSTTGYIIGAIVIIILVLFLLKKIEFTLPDKKYVPLLVFVGLLPFIWLFVFAVHAGHGFDGMSFSVFLFALFAFGASMIKHKHPGVKNLL